MTTFREESGAMSRREYSGEVAARQSSGWAVEDSGILKWLLGCARVSDCHFLGDLKRQLSVSFIRLAQQPAKLVEIAGLFAKTAPCNFIRRFSLGQVRQFWWFLAPRKTIDRAGTQELAQSSPTSRWLEQYGHFQHGKCSSEAGLYVSQCRLAKSSFPRAFRGCGRQ